MVFQATDEPFSSCAFCADRLLCARAIAQASSGGGRHLGYGPQLLPPSPQLNVGQRPLRWGLEGGFTEGRMGGGSRRALGGGGSGRDGWGGGVHVGRFGVGLPALALLLTIPSP